MGVLVEPKSRQVKPKRNVIDNLGLAACIGGVVGLALLIFGVVRERNGPTGEPGVVSLLAAMTILFSGLLFFIWVHAAIGRAIVKGAKSFGTKVIAPALTTVAQDAMATIEAESSADPKEVLPVNSPTPPSRTEPWRRPTPSRFLENLKRELVNLEDELHSKQESLAEIRPKQPYQKGIFKGISEFREGWLESSITNLSQKIVALKTRVDNIWAGNVRAEIGEVDLRIKHLRKDQEKLVEQFSALPDPAGIWFSSTKRQEAQKQRDLLAGKIERIDRQVLDLDADLEDLRTLDSFLLSKDLGLDHAVGSALRASKEELADIKTKVETIESIRPKPAGAREKSEDEQKFEQKRSKRYIDVQDKIFEELEVPAQEAVEAHIAYKKLRRQIIGHSELTPEDKDELLQRLQNRFAQRMKEAGLSIYEED